jgi:hypothetical protein
MYLLNYPTYKIKHIQNLQHNQQLNQYFIIKVLDNLIHSTMVLISNNNKCICFVNMCSNISIDLEIINNTILKFKSKYIKKELIR